MSFKRRLKAAINRVNSDSSANAGSASRSDSEGYASRQAAAREQSQAAAKRAAAAARSGAKRTAARLKDAEPRGSAVDTSGMSRTQAMFARAQNAATAGAPVDVSLDPTPDEMAMWQFASISNDTPVGSPGGIGEPEPWQHSDDQQQSVPASEPATSVLPAVSVAASSPTRSAARGGSRGRASTHVEDLLVAEAASNSETRQQDGTYGDESPDTAGGTGELAFADPFGAAESREASEANNDNDWGWL